MLGLIRVYIFLSSFKQLYSIKQWQAAISFELGQVMNMRGLENLICGAKGAEWSHFSFSQILAATDNLSERNLVGNGGFGYVYKVMFSRENLYYEISYWTA
jgi:hypothetical protein